MHKNTILYCTKPHTTKFKHQNLAFHLNIKQFKSFIEDNTLHINWGIVCYVSMSYYKT